MSRVTVVVVSVSNVKSYSGGGECTLCQELQWWW